MAHHPIFWTFRRCPYAIRARLALLSSGVRVELREILLRDKPATFLQTSPSGTVPALRLPDRVLDESLEIMIWALQQNDPQRLLEMPQAGWHLIEVNDGPFKATLDHTKYATRYPDLDPKVERNKAASYLHNLDERLAGRSWLFGSRPTIADLALLPFVRQFAHIDRMWFDGQEWLNLTSWLNRFLECEAFLQVMNKYSPWSEGDAPTWFNS
ncbi:glutathione S-transferase [Ruegeria conchae]|uniref:glutathione S-transferase n=1 Tax=Ruegeria conchae TaxID=981384 RepID=UPI0021A77F23|nr:glutathione S-transferase [Ruegeria conchae]UWR03683.1 glutathione S-transferase [Ruegeria conchae]